VKALTRQGHLPELEGLRGVAAGSIVVYHVWVFSSGATLTWNLGPATGFMKPLQSGVTLFFVISGFLLYRPFLSGTVSIRRYLRNRALRILPAYWFVLLVSGLLLGSSVVRATNRGNVAGYLNRPRLLATNLTLTQGYNPRTAFTGILPAWSLVVEVAFYALLPIIAVALVRRNASAPAIAFIAFGLAAKIVLSLTSLDGMRALTPTWSATVAHSFLGHADLFGYGMAAAVLYERWQQNGRPTWIDDVRIGRLLAYAGLPCAILGFYALPAFLYESLVAVFTSLMLLRVAAPAARPGLLRSRLVQTCGRVSYSMFLWNYPLLMFLAVHGWLVTGTGPFPFAANLVVAGLCVGAASLGTYRFVELPCLRLRAPRHAVAAAPAAAASSGLISAG
jgi:peptidoglycan/LPS O-acetylase OafA/YrhL